MEEDKLKSIFTVFVSVLLASAMTCGEVWAQATAQITGAVRDQSGAVLPGVEVTAIQTDTGISRNAITNETGSYVLPNLSVGPYRFEATLPGFRTFVQTGIVLQVNSNPVINVVLELGQVTEQVEVQANASLVETRTTAVGQVIENERILELPLNGRQVTDLITLSGAAVQTAASNSRLTFQSGVLISIAGGLNFGVMYSLDGSLHNNVYDGSQMPMPFPDALQEFKVEASGIGAAGGTRGSGGQVNAVTKSGTNQFHGDLFEFVRNYKFNARNFFFPKRDSLKRNQFGGTLGGPVLQNKLFFFGGYQGTRTRSDPGDTLRFVPTTAMLAGDFTTFASAACNAGRPVPLRAPFVNNRIDPALYSKAALTIASRLPQAQDECGKFVYGLAAKLNELQAVAKIDYQWSAKHSVFGRYLATTFLFPHPYNTVQHDNILTTSDDGSSGNDNLAQSYALGSTYLIGPSTVNAFRLAANRVALTRDGASFFSAPSIGVKAWSSIPDHLILSVTGGFNLGNRRYTHIVTNSYQVGDDVSLSRGNHQMTFGANLTHWRNYQRNNNEDVGNYSFTGTALGLGIADFLTGRLTTLMQNPPTQYTEYQWYVGAYAADVWRMSPKLTLNYGLRWEPYLPEAVGYGQGSSLNEGAMYHFSDNRFSRGIKSAVYPNAPAGLYYPGDPGFPKGGPNNKKWHYAAPRIGVAWDVNGDGRTSVRASYGMAFDFSGAGLGGSSNAPPYGITIQVQSPAGGFEDPWRDYPGGNPFPYSPRTALFPTFSQFYFIGKYDMSEPTVQTWNLSIQKQVPADILISGTYLGRQSYHLWEEGNINRAVYFPGAPVNGVCRAGNYVLQTTGTACSTTGNTDQRRRLFLENPQEGRYYGNLATREDSGNQNYHGLLLSIQRRAARGVNISANYTWSHCVGDNPSASTLGRGGGGYLDPDNRDFDRGNCTADRRQIFNVTGVASTPQFANPTLHAIATGWRLSGIYKWQSGSYLTLSTGLDRALSGFAGNQRPNQVLENPYGDRESLTTYLNLNAFAQPDLGTIGNMRRANIESPGFFQFDMALSRVFQVRENQKMEFRAESFNVTNSLRKGTPTMALNSNTFGQITTAADARIMQFALKYSF
jgi:hypothetical protein